MNPVIIKAPCHCHHYLAHRDHHRHHHDHLHRDHHLLLLSSSPSSSSSSSSPILILQLRVAQVSLSSSPIVSSHSSVQSDASWNYCSNSCWLGVPVLQVRNSTAEIHVSSSERSLSKVPIPVVVELVLAACYANICSPRLSRLSI